MASVTDSSLNIPLSEKLKNLPAIFGVKPEEGPKYYVVQKDGDFQIRKYRPFLIAQTCVKGTFQEATSRAFKILAQYIFGRNDQSEKMQMTAPVFMARGEKMSMTSRPEDKLFEGWMMSFVLPLKYVHGEAPRPYERSIELIQVPSLLVASLKYTGTNSEEKIAEKSAELVKWLESRPEYNLLSEPRCAQYNPPFSLPFLRRNEVQITVGYIKNNRH